MINLLGIILVLDGLLSMILVKDKKFLWQLGRLARIMIGLYLVSLKR
jgi:hypothetical protein